MKVNTLLMAGLLGMGVVSGANAANTLNITGSIDETACTVVTDSIPVPLGGISKAEFTVVGQPVGTYGFPLELASCPAGKVSVRFSGEEEDDSGLLKLSTSGLTATGVGVGIYEQDGTTLIPINSDSKPITIDTAGGGATFNFTAAYVATNLEVTGGSANATANFVINHE